MREPEWDELPEGAKLQSEFERLQRRDWELWSIALLLLTVFAGGVVMFFYSQFAKESEEGTAAFGFYFQVLFALVALVVLLNAYLIDRKRFQAHLWRRYLLQSQELQQARELGSLDPLTKVFSRRHFDEVVRKEALRCERTEKPLSLMLLHLKDFEKVNQELGHFVGDQILQAVARTLQTTMRTSDMVFRYGGDDFMVLLPETSEEGAACAEKRLRERLASQKEVSDRLGHPMPVAIFHSCYQKGKNLDKMLELMESALVTSDVDESAAST